MPHRQLKWEIQNLKEGMDKRLRDLDEDIAKRRASIQESYQQELNDLVTSNQERKAEALASYQERLEDLRIARSEQLQELGKTYREEGKITEDAMSEIAQKVAIPAETLEQYHRFVIEYNSFAEQFRELIGELKQVARTEVEPPSVKLAHEVLTVPITKEKK